MSVSTIARRPGSLLLRLVEAVKGTVMGLDTQTKKMDRLLTGLVLWLDPESEHDQIIMPFMRDLLPNERFVLSDVIGSRGSL